MTDKGAADGRPQLQLDDLDELSERVGQVSMDTEDGGELSEDNKVQLPNVLIVTNIHDSVFSDDLTRVGFHFNFLFCFTQLVNYTIYRS